MAKKIYTVGDSIAKGVCEQAGIPCFATGGMFVRDMGPHFENLLKVVQAGDRVIVSAGYNGGINFNDQKSLTQWIQRLVDAGAEVAILPLREEGLEGGPYESSHGKTKVTNNKLREIEAATGALFVKEGIAVANAISKREIHGNYDLLFATALEAFDNAPTRHNTTNHTMVASHSDTTKQATPPRSDGSVAPEKARDVASDQPLHRKAIHSTPAIAAARPPAPRTSHPPHAIAPQHPTAAHVQIKTGDTMSGIASKLLGSQPVDHPKFTRFQEETAMMMVIAEANVRTVPDINRIKAGNKLIIPDDAAAKVTALLNGDFGKIIKTGQASTDACNQYLASIAKSAQAKIERTS